jgi:RNA polymerase sigma-70 factor (sigma-E family)
VRNGHLEPPGATDGPAAGAVAVLFREHHGELVRLALLMVGDLPTAEDVVQDVYASLHARWSRAAACHAPLPYVRAAVLNACRSVLRRRGMARRVGALHRASVRDDPLGSAESEVILSEDRRQVLDALARLPHRRREVLVLRYYLGLSEAEIAAVLGISAGTVKSTAARGLAALARDLGEKS